MQDGQSHAFCRAIYVHTVMMHVLSCHQAIGTNGIQQCMKQEFCKVSKLKSSIKSEGSLRRQETVCKTPQSLGTLKTELQ